MDNSFIQQIYKVHQECTRCPSSADIKRFFSDLLGVLFPNFASKPVHSLTELEERVIVLRKDMESILYSNLVKGSNDPQKIIDTFFDKMPEVYDRLQKDIDATYEGDPAARSREEVVRAYPGFYAIAAYRVAHLLARLGVSTVPRLITEHAHSKTGIDIHPKATIGEYFCIDHGTGIVIGETTIIGDRVKIYQGVTLGALSVSKRDAERQRHPTIEDNVVIYSGATILGGETIIGHNSIIGGNVWLTRSVPAYSKVYYQAHMHNSKDDTTDLIILK
ncbi:Serine acetyltransferase [Fulvivirga imtechensis AK7]|uniref:Serine acetyltransferase n=1 Tax=Fulvivirga imtechensis AK7 TaxID=1237149 RepID=L8JRG3_9BACT|nr:serine O-acetyltransferase [Fulvivirga imtechensis]ELR70084.1 Serine acetyltransferase [Fulvivirga imtechensis AK7]